MIRSGPGAGLSFAIPINKAKKIAKELVRTGKVIHPMIGITLLNEFNFETNKMFVKVDYVIPRSPAENNGILKNDFILKINQKDVNSSTDVVNAIANNGINKYLNILLSRNNKLINIKIRPIDIRNLTKN